MIILSLLLCSGMAAGYSQTLSLRKGHSIARQFLNEKMSSTFSGKWQERYFGDGKLMIVNRGDNDGFVIIRSDGDNHTILGYAEHGHINTEAMPENLRYWLQCYAAENEPTTLSYSSNNHEYTAHAPLLATIAWDQNSPYNLMTPYYVGTTHAATGCAATAMAQILYYHHWPLQGKGTVSYSCSTLNNATLETDLSKDIYHWDAMKTQYNIPGQEDSDEARQAVALLMRDCGYAIHMLYGAQIGETGVTPSQYVQAMGFDARTGLFIWQAVDSKGSNLYAGIDTPLAVEDLTVKADATDKKAAITWNAPKGGQHGGHIGSSLQYVVFEYFPNETEKSKKLKIITTTTDHSSVFAQDSDHQANHYIGVMPMTSKGAGDILLRNVILGKPYDLPYQESFKNGAETTDLWTADASSSDGNWSEAQSDNSYQAEDGDNGFARFWYGGYGGALSAWLTTPKFALADGAKVSFWVYKGVSANGSVNPSLSVWQNTDDGEYLQLGDSIDVTKADKAGWVEVTLPLNYSAGAHYATLRFIAKGYAYPDMILIDNITVGDKEATGISALHPTNTTGVVRYRLDGTRETRQRPASGIYIERTNKQAHTVLVK